jgi:hypothetical protein
VIGAIPIFFYLPCLFTRSTSGSIHTPKVIYRLVGTLDKKKKNLQNGTTTGQANVVSSLSIVLAGVILWAVSLYIQL